MCRMNGRESPKTGLCEPQNERPSVASWTASDDCRLLSTGGGASTGGSLTARAAARFGFGQREGPLRLRGRSETVRVGGHRDRIRPTSVLCRSGGYRPAEPPQSHGFTVVLRTAKIVDEGTGFDIVVWADGRSQVHVAEGAVEVRMANAQTVLACKRGKTWKLSRASRQSPPASSLATARRRSNFRRSSRPRTRIMPTPRRAMPRCASCRVRWAFRAAR